MRFDQNFLASVINHVGDTESPEVTPGGGDEGKENGKIKLEDKRKVLGATGASINKEKDLKSGSYNEATIKNVIKAAKKKGVDPNTALAVALQETHFGNLNPENLGNVYTGSSKAPEGYDQQAWDLVSILKEKMTEGQKLGFKDENMLIQMYNGLGKLGPSKTIGVKPIDTYYGIKVTKEHPLDLRKNPLYGKTIIDLRENIIKKSEAIQKLISTNEL